MPKWKYVIIVNMINAAYKDQKLAKIPLNWPILKNS
jgi:hypothetical protein